MKKFAPALFCCSFLLIGAGCSSSVPYAATPQAEAPSTQPTTAPAPTPAPAPAPAPTPSPSSKKTASISGFSFQPASMTVKAGTMVVWTNQDPMAHTVTADDGSFDSGPIAPGATYGHAFTQTGSFSYHCSVHPSMRATIIVQ